MFELFTGLLTAPSILGVWFNIKRRRVCFAIWAVTNLSWAAVDFHREIYAQAALFLVYFALAIWGVFEWRKN